MSKKTFKKINTTSGPEFIPGQEIDGEFKPSHTGKRFKTKKGVIRFLER